MNPVESRQILRFALHGTLIFQLVTGYDLDEAQDELVD